MSDVGVSGSTSGDEDRSPLQRPRFDFAFNLTPKPPRGCQDKNKTAPRDPEALPLGFFREGAIVIAIMIWGTSLADLSHFGSEVLHWEVSFGLSTEARYCDAHALRLVVTICSMCLGSL